ncbi:MAG: SDR family NAD(P)-dependent oxidoreductase [Chloroflexi bacterium]|nr:SDR family NAD(P)-dependent oxidoreductase [Chloroflexota bacterium]MBT7080596.1 SDR family NAD(P)-dependent oxidoreductase [Chloroflexota bacterium]MBT7290350.1 SDR family NAD(P)-dependent oxidoreductase [Chloroflexota bacterium]
MITVKNKVVIVTGAGQGIGRTYAKVLASDGAKVVVAEINETTGMQTLEAIKTSGGQAIFAPTDVTDFKSVQQMVTATLDAYERIDALVNNAAIYYGIDPKPFTQITEDEWDRMMNVNVKGAWNCARAVAPQLVKQGKGKIINVASSVAFEGKAMFMHYVASKGAIVSMSRAMARELAEMSGGGITVNALCPGAISGEASVKLGQAMRNVKGFEGKGGPVAGQIIKRRGTPEDLVGPLTYLISDASDFMTGSALTVDGGSSLH